MKQILLLCILTLSLAAIAIPGDGTRPVRRIIITQQTIATIPANSGIAEIVVASDASKATAFAATELQTFLNTSLNTTIPIVNQPTPGKTSFILGINQWSKQAGIDEKTLCRDAFIIKTDGGRIYILGRDDANAAPEKNLKDGAWPQLFERGTLFGVYDFLERFVGVRMYFPGENGTVIPRLSVLKIPEINIFDRPDFESRKISWYEGEWPEGENRKKFVSPEKNLNYYRLRLETNYIPNCHGLARLSYIQRFGKTNPEYFALMEDGNRHCNPALRHPGQLCFSSGVREEIYQDAKAFLSGKPISARNIPRKVWDPSGFQPGYFGIMPQDGFYRCNCPKCKSQYQPGDHYASELIWNFVIDCAERLKQENVPGYLTMMVYRPYRILPKKAIPDNVLIMVAEHGPWGESNPHLQKRDSDEIINTSKKIGRKVWIWNYVNKFGVRAMPGIPCPTPLAIDKYYKSLVPWIFGAYMETETDKYIYYYLNYYVFAKLAWDNKVDVNSLLEEHYRLMFGKAAEPMGSLFRLYEKIWLNEIGGKTVDTALGPVGVTPSNYELWHNVFSAERVAQLTAEFDCAEALAAGDEASLKRVKMIRRDYLEQLKSTRNDYLKQSSALNALTFPINTVKEKININDKPDDRVWSQSAEIWLSPLKNEGKKFERTTVKGLKDDSNLYFLIECDEPAMGNVIASKREFDNQDIWRDNSVEIFINPSDDGKNYYQFMINSTGAFSDLRCTKAGASQQLDFKWNSDATVKTFVADGKWFAEVVIPLKSMPEINRNGFKANFIRNRVLANSNILYSWSQFINNSHDLENFGKLVFNAVPSRSIINNGDFAASKTGTRNFGQWCCLPQMPQSQKVELDQTVFLSDGKSMKLSSSEDKEIILTQYLPDLKPSTKYRLSYFVKLEDVKLTTKESGANVNISDERNRWFPERGLRGTMPWNKQYFDFTTGPETGKKSKPYIRLRLNGIGAAWFDNVSLEEIL